MMKIAERIICLTILFFPLMMSAQNDTVITGKMNQTDFEQDWAVEWKKNQLSSKTDAEIIGKIKAILEKRDVFCRVFLGTWCEDSKANVPVLLKIANQTGLTCEFWGVSREKECPLPDCSNWDVDFVPTFEIIFKGHEIGRIVETPTNTVEADLLLILEKIPD